MAVKMILDCPKNVSRMPRRASKMPPKTFKAPQTVSNYVKMPSPCKLLAKSLPDCKIRQRCLPTMVNHNGLLQRPCLSTKDGLAMVRPRRASSINTHSLPTIMSSSLSITLIPKPTLNYSQSILCAWKTKPNWKLSIMALTNSRKQKWLLKRKQNQKSMSSMKKIMTLNYFSN